MHRAFLLISAVLLLQAAVLADTCNDPADEQAWKLSPVYGDATTLAQLLQSHGITIECIRRSKEEHMFQGQKGAAWFKSNQGIFEAWFLPASEDFKNWEVTEVGRNGRYLYSFRGSPAVPAPIDSSRPITFIKHGKVLLEIWGNQPLAERLGQALSE